MGQQANITKVQKSNIVRIDVSKDRVIPQAPEMEEAVLAAMLISGNAVDECLMLIKTSDVFFKEEHRVIFEAIQQMHKDSVPIDLLTLSMKLRSMGTLETAGGDLAIMQLTHKISSTAHIEIHTRLLIQQWIKRQMIKDASELMVKAYSDETDVFDLITDASTRIDQINEYTSAGSADLTMEAAMLSIQQRIEVLSAKDSEEISGLYTGFKKVDKITSGWQPSDLIVIAARPGMGKTSLVLRTVLENVKHGNPVGFISCEMSTQQLITRMVACNSHFHLNQLFRTGFEHSKYWQQFRLLKEEMEKFPAYFDDTSIDLYDIVNKIRLWKRKFGIKLAVIDYLQLMSCKTLGKNSIREQEISTITRTLKRLAKELNIPILLLSQLSRDVESRGSSKRPMLKDLRESGAIEQDADVVCFIYRPSYYNIEPDDDMIAAGGNTEFIIAKHRNGSIDRKILHFDENKTKFMDPEDIQQTDEHDAMMTAQATGMELPKPSATAAFGSDPGYSINDLSDTPF